MLKLLFKKLFSRMVARSGIHSPGKNHAGYVEIFRVKRGRFPDTQCYAIREPVMTEDQMSKTLDAIHDEAARLLNFEGPEKEREMSDGLQLIMSLARYKFDVRSI